ncbi:protein of unknown function [Pseudomonas sp. JV241A]|nr:protein of unknown function [Pseudomonas sp. JV241A]
MDLCTPDLWEPDLPAIEPAGVVIQATLMCWLDWPHRWQASSHRGSVYAGPVGAGLAGDRARSGRNPAST